MKSDIDRLMMERDLQAIIITGGEENNVPRQYLTNGADITGGYVIKKRGSEPILIVNAMELEEANKSGLKVHTYYDFGWADLIQQAEGDSAKATIGFWGRFLDELKIPPGKVGIYGTGAINVYIEIIRNLSAAYPDYEFVGETGLTLFDAAYATKDAAELARMRSVAQRTSEVLQATWDFIAGHTAEPDESLVNGDGEALTIGAVKRFVLHALLDRGLQDTGMIFAQGRDAGYPHSRGEAHMALKMGQSIVFDLFPQELGGGYYHDTTRTWCIGYAPPEVQAAYADVANAFDVAVDGFRPNLPTHVMQEAVLNYLEGRGHQTTRSHPGTLEGYVHGLGHGVGLNIHERPSLNHLIKTDTFQPGMVVTIEPGVYYPERGFGVRLEDTFYVTEDGQLVSLTDFHKDLIIPLETNG